MYTASEQYQHNTNVVTLHKGLISVYTSTCTAMETSRYKERKECFNVTILKVVYGIHTPIAVWERDFSPAFSLSK